MNWTAAIGTLLYVKDAIATVDEEELFPHQLPRVAASEEQLRLVETLRKTPLDRQYRSFLSHADGWPAFFQDCDLFGCPELSGSEALNAALRRMGEFDEAAWGEAELDPKILLPIGASRTALDLFVMSKIPESTPGEVIWIAGTVVERFGSFEEFFLGMIDYNRETFRSLASDGVGGGS